jgi:hypothetical protein
MLTAQCSLMAGGGVPSPLPDARHLGNRAASFTPQFTDIEH